MNPAHSTIGLTLLVAALVVGMEQHRETQKGEQAAERTKNWTQSWQTGQSQLDTQKTFRSSKRESLPTHPLLTEEERSQIFRTLDLAHQRLQREHHQLHLTKEQRQALFPLILRSELDYNPDLPYPIGRQGSYLSLGTAISRAEYGALLTPLLTPEQEQERTTQSEENDAWWSHIIGLLEEDLNQQTETAPAPEFVPIPLPDPVPPPADPSPAPKPEPEPETETIAPSRSSLRGSRNLLDLLEP